MHTAILQIQAPSQKLQHIFDDWSEDAVNFLRHGAPKILWALVIAFILLMVFRTLRNKLIEHSKRQDLPTGLRAQQLRTLAGVIYSVGVFVVIFYAATTI